MADSLYKCHVGYCLLCELFLYTTAFLGDSLLYWHIYYFLALVVIGIKTGTFESWLLLPWNNGKKQANKNETPIYVSAQVSCIILAFRDDACWLLESFLFWQILQFSYSEGVLGVVFLVISQTSAMKSQNHTQTSSCGYLRTSLNKVLVYINEILNMKIQLSILPDSSLLIDNNSCSSKLTPLYEWTWFHTSWSINKTSKSNCKKIASKKFFLQYCNECLFHDETALELWSWDCLESRIGCFVYKL